MEKLADYVVRREMREGNHGIVYLAEPPARLGIEDDVVALKTLREHGDDQDFRRVANELRLLASVDSPHVIELLDAGNASGQLFFVTKYYPEGSLEDAHVRIEEQTIRRCVADAALGIHALHEIGIAHRDVKPANILINKGRGVIAELGLAQLVGGRSTTVGGGPLGALEFTAPDIIWGNDATRRTDIWSLGMTLHRALTGASALGDIPETGLLDACRHVLETRPVVDAGLDSPTRIVLERCFAEEVAEGYSTAEEFALDLENTMTGATV